MKAYILVGAPGSGKSTWSKEFLSKNPDVVRVSHDEAKAKIGSGEDDKNPEVARQAYAVVRGNFEQGLATGKDVMVDMTNMWRSRRKDFVKLARKYNADTIAVVFEATRETCIERNEKRKREGGRYVSPEVIDEMLSKYYRPDELEFDEVMFVTKVDA